MVCTGFWTFTSLGNTAVYATILSPPRGAGTTLGKGTDPWLGRRMPDRLAGGGGGGRVTIPLPKATGWSSASAAARNLTPLTGDSWDDHNSWVGDCVTG